MVLSAPSDALESLAVAVNGSQTGTGVLDSVLYLQKASLMQMTHQCRYRNQQVMQQGLRAYDGGSSLENTESASRGVLR